MNRCARCYVESKETYVCDHTNHRAMCTVCYQEIHWNLTNWHVLPIIFQVIFHYSYYYVTDTFYCISWFFIACIRLLVETIWSWVRYNIELIWKLIWYITLDSLTRLPLAKIMFDSRWWDLKNLLMINGSS